MSRILSWVLVLALCLVGIDSLMTSFMKSRKYRGINKGLRSPMGINLTTSCNAVNLTPKYNYSGIVKSGYLKVDKANSVLAFLFYGKKDVTDPQQLKNFPTILWLNGGPGSSSQLGNLQYLGPLLLIRDFDVKVVTNNYTWANNYNLLFVDQPVGTGLSYADDSAGNPFVKSMDEVANDFYFALSQLYNSNDGCFSPIYLNIPPSAPLIIFGESYAGKYVPAIAKKIVEMKENRGFLTGLKGIGIGDGFTYPYMILSYVGTFAYHLSLLDYQERTKLERMLLNASRHELQSNYDLLHIDFDNAIEYIVERAGNVNVYDIKIDGDYEGINENNTELLQPYFNNPEYQRLYNLNPAIVYDSQSEDVYNNLFTDFMMPEVSRVQYLLGKGMNVLIYNGQDDLIVQNPGTMKWVDRLHHDSAEEFRAKLFSPWKINGKVVGSIKSAGLLYFRIVNKAGHLVPMDRPVEALDMVNSFVTKIMNITSSESIVQDA